MVGKPRSGFHAQEPRIGFHAGTQNRVPAQNPEPGSCAEPRSGFCARTQNHSGSLAAAAAAEAVTSVFVFKAPSDEEPELLQSEEDEDDEEAGEEQGSEEAEDKPSNSKGQKQFPWDFASYSESVAEDHAHHGTTSVDFKISEVLHQSSTRVDDEPSDSEPDKQEDYRSEDEDDDKSNAGNSKSFFGPSEGASFHANSFMELNLSRPLFRALEAMGLY
ncbi:hypothetical protein SLEP1_g4156 [Rubroshorea leprosula]|uniref:Uncharacterized protein n=1 Tax=Rubroshorea leprosula TaxID=152421 RepID=A0AAV5HS52_9ROSI|nr:hypothetical protein SLEP1_g4156 [Rubroshorea leprosula]